MPLLTQYRVNPSLVVFFGRSFNKRYKHPAFLKYMSTLASRLQDCTPFAKIAGQANPMLLPIP
jgi:hypothetical protein